MGAFLRPVCGVDRITERVFIVSALYVVAFVLAPSRHLVPIGYTSTTPCMKTAEPELANAG